MPTDNRATATKSFVFEPQVRSYFADKPVCRAYLFGSYSRNEEHETSDIDILVELDYEKGADFFGLLQMQEDLSALCAKPVDLVSANGLSAFIRPYIESDRVLIYDNAALR